MLKFFVGSLTYAMNTWDDLRERQEGQTMAEYGVVLAVLTIATVGVFTLLSGGIKNAINEVIKILPGNAG